MSGCAACKILAKTQGAQHEVRYGTQQKWIPDHVFGNGNPLSCKLGGWQEREGAVGGRARKRMKTLAVELSWEGEGWTNPSPDEERER